VPKSLSASVVGSNRGAESSVDPKLVGETNEVNVLINDKPLHALLDTGSCVSVISHSFYREHISDVQLQTIDDLVNIECADGKQLPYLGYVEVELSIAEGLPNANTVSSLFLVTPDTVFSERTPAIIGTNILKELLKDCKDTFGPQYLQRASLHTPWYLSFRCMAIRERKLHQSKGRLGVVKCALLQKVTLHPNETRDIPGYIDKELDYPATAAMMLEADDSCVAEWLDVEPSVINYRFRKNREVFVNLSNLKPPSHIPRDLTASLLRPCYDSGRSTVAMDAAGAQRGRSEEPKDAQGRRPSATILNMHKTVAEKQKT